MTFRIENMERPTLAEMEEFAKSNRGIKIAAAEKADSYDVIERVLRGRVTGFSRAQITRPIGRWRQMRQVQRQPAQRPSFVQRYRREDIVLPGVDAAIRS